jgi:hypothetical protein
MYLLVSNYVESKIDYALIGIHHTIHQKRRSIMYHCIKKNEKYEI